jgi:hypothetical protein
MDIIYVFCLARLLVVIKTVIVLCGDGFMDFVHRPKSKILKILKN